MQQPWSAPVSHSCSQLRQFFGARHKLQRQAVVAIAQSGRFRAVVENMALMATATGAMIFRARPDQFEIGFGQQRARKVIIKTGPTGPAVILGRTIEQWQITCGADKSAGTLLAVK